MFSKKIKLSLVAAAIAAAGCQTAAAQGVATLSPSGESINVATLLANKTWQANSRGRSGSAHIAYLTFAIENGKLVGKTIYWPNSKKTSPLVVEELAGRNLVATTVVTESCSNGVRERKLTYEGRLVSGSKEPFFRLEVSGPLSRCRRGRFEETGRLKVRK